MNEVCCAALPPLPYSYDALKPCISAETLHIHHDKLMGKAFSTLQGELEQYPQYCGWSVEQLLWDCPCLPVFLQTPVHRNAGSVFAHELYFDGMTPAPARCEPYGKLEQAIVRCFGSVEHFWEVFFKTADAHFGNGWIWLAANRRGDLKICATGGHDTPLDQCLRPVLVADLWEHAYFLDYQNRRADYLKAWKNIIDWDFAEANYNIT